MSDTKVLQVLKKAERIETSELRKQFADYLLEVFRGSMILVTRYGRELAAFVTLKDAARLKILKSPEFRATLKAIDAKLK